MHMSRCWSLGEEREGCQMHRGIQETCDSGGHVKNAKIEIGVVAVIGKASLVAVTMEKGSKLSREFKAIKID